MLTSIKSNSLSRSPYLIFLPFLLLYVAFVFANSENKLIGDELRYFFFAKNLTHGYYWYPGSPIALANGPGYPILLLPFVALDLPLIYPKLVNAILQYLSIIFLFKALKQIVPIRTALIVCFFWACYYNFFEFMALLYSETLSIFLVSLLVFFLTKAFNQTAVKKKHIYLSGFIIGYLTLTKVIFGYVIFFMLVASAILLLIKRNSVNYRKGLIILSIAFITTLPYLIYTYKLTGKVFYWSSVGGDNLYWMSTPYTDEYGSWFWFAGLEQRPDSIKEMNSIVGLDSFRSHHQKVWDEIKKYDEIAQDDMLKQIATNNIKSHPIKFLQNCMSNMGRILFNFPYSYTVQKPNNLLRLPLNGIILVCLLFCMVPTFMNWKKIIYPIRFLIVFIFLYLGGSVLGSAETRMFTIAVPVLLFWIAFIIQKTMKINLKFR